MLYKRDYNIPLPRPRLARKRDYLVHAIAKPLQKYINIGRPAIINVRASRGLGKTYAIATIIDQLASSLDNQLILFVSATIKNLYKTVVAAEFTKFEDTTKYRRDRKTDTFTHISTGTRVVFSGSDDKKSLQQNRGLHPNFLFFDEGQSISFQDYQEVFGRMGNTKGCIQVLTSTGGGMECAPATYESLLLEQSEVQPLLGETIRLTIYDVYKENPAQEWYDLIKQWEFEYCPSHHEVDENGKKIRVKDGEFYDNPRFGMEILVEDVDGNIEGDPTFPEFVDELYPVGNVVDDEVLDRYFPKQDGDRVIDIKRDVWAVFDTGSKDPYCLHMYQRVGEQLILFAEMYHKYSGRSQYSFKLDVADFLEDLGYTIDRSVPDKPKLGEDTKRISWIGDDHGHGNWNPFMREAFNIDVEGVAGAAESFIDTLNNLFATKQVLIHEQCTNARKHFGQMRSKFDSKTQKYGMDHKISHSVVTTLYLVGSGQVELEPLADIPEPPKVNNDYIDPWQIMASGIIYGTKDVKKNRNIYSNAKDGKSVWW